MAWSMVVECCVLSGVPSEQAAMGTFQITTLGISLLTTLGLSDSRSVQTRGCFLLTTVSTTACLFY